MGITTALLPATVLSTQTECLGTPAALTTTRWQQQAARHWSQLPLSFQGALVGYLGSVPAVQTAQQVLRDLAPARLVVDPAMADQGQLYPGLSTGYPETIRELCQAADVITPNWTELCLLTGQPVVEPTAPACLKMARLLRGRGISAQLVVTGVRQGKQVGCWLVQTDQLLFSGADYFPGHFYGTGDCFAALLYGYLTAGADLRTAVAGAERALAVAVRETSLLSDADRQLGMRLTDLVSYLVREK